MEKLKQIIAEMQDLLDSGDPAKFRYIKEWKEQLEGISFSGYPLTLTKSESNQSDRFIGMFVHERDAFDYAFEMLRRDENDFLGFTIGPESITPEVDELKNILAESYQVIGYLASECDLFDDPQVLKALDNTSQQRMVHDDVLPFNPQKVVDKT